MSTQVETPRKTLAEDILISTYVPDADMMTREEALALAIKRDEESATALYNDVMEAKKKERDERIDQIMKDLGYDQ